MNLKSAGNIFLSFYAFGLTSCLSTASLGADAGPTPFDVPRVNGVTVDGRAADWGTNGFSVEMFTTLQNVLPTHDDLSAVARWGWDERGLLVLLEVQDDVAREGAEAELAGRDSIAVYVASSREEDNRYQVLVSPGIAPEYVALRQQLTDYRKDPALKKTPLEAQSVRVPHAGGYTLEMLLPWKNLGITPEIGRQVAAQIQINDVDEGAERTQWLWFPRSGTQSDSRRMNTLRLTQAPSPSVRVVARAAHERLRRIIVNVTGAPDLIGKTALVKEGDRVLVSGTLRQGESKWASARLTVPMPPRGQSYTPLSVWADSQYQTTLPLLDSNVTRRDAFNAVRLLFQSAVFSGTNFPPCEFEQPSLVEDLIGQYELKATYYDADFNPVTTAQRAGRYGAIVEVRTAGGIQGKRFVTLFRQAEPINWGTTRLPVTVELPSQLGIDPVVARERANLLEDFMKWRFADGSWQEPETAILLAALHETKTGEPYLRRFSPRRQDERWWYTLKKKTGDAKPLKYLVTLPLGYDADAAKRWPIMVFLHGSGETGDNLELVKENGPPRLVAQGQNFPFILVSPQAPTYGWIPMQLNDFLDEIIAKYRVDPDRIYLTGLSMGGTGTWNFALSYPQRFAAIAPMAAGGDETDVEPLKDLPIWYFVGGKDGTVPVSAHKMVQALKKVGSSVRFTEYPEAGHVDTWVRAYDDPAFYEWLLKQRRH
jgi:pimeloyl-ACP methyl ester carboxylesterase